MKGGRAAVLKSGLFETHFFLMALREYQCREKTNVLQNNRQELRLEPRARPGPSQVLRKCCRFVFLSTGPFSKRKGEEEWGKEKREGGKGEKRGERKEEGGEGKKRGERKEEGGKGKKRGGKEKKKRKRRSAIIHAAATHAFTVFFF